MPNKRTLMFQMVASLAFRLREKNCLSLILQFKQLSMTRITMYDINHREIISTLGPIAIFF